MNPSQSRRNSKVGQGDETAYEIGDKMAIGLEESNRNLAKDINTPSTAIHVPGISITMNVPTATTSSILGSLVHFVKKSSARAVSSLAPERGIWIILGTSGNAQLPGRADDGDYSNYSPT